MSSIRLRCAALWSFSVSWLATDALAAQAPATERASVGAAGTQANNESSSASVSLDGRCVAFFSSASNLVVGDTNNQSDVFVRDRQLGTTERVSLHTSGTQGNSHSQYCAISGDGARIAFVSYASNLVDDDTNGWWEIFLRDRAAGTTTRVSVTHAGLEANGASLEPAISADGRFVAFRSSATNLVPGDSNGVNDIFVRDLQLGTTARASVSSGGTEANGDNARPSLSADGRYLAFSSWASNFVAGDTNGWPDIFVRDLQLGTTVLVSVGMAGAPANGDNRLPSISSDGRFVAFESFASNLLAGDTNAWQDIYVRDLASGTTDRASLDSSGVPANYVSNRPSISGDGRYVAFHSDATNLVPGDTNFAFDVFLRDRVLGVTERMSVTTGGAEVLGSSSTATISSDGRCVAFESTATTLVGGDTNGVPDVFVRDRGTLPPSSYCTAGTTTNGCSASISASANPSVSLANACSIAAAGVEGQKSGVLFYGIDNTGFAPSPWAAGSTSLRCVKPPAQRTPTQNSGGTANQCDGAFALDWNAYQASQPTALGNPWSVGAEVFAQAWFRDPPAVKSTSLSNALKMTYVP